MYHDDEEHEITVSVGCIALIMLAVYVLGFLIGRLV